MTTIIRHIYEGHLYAFNESGWFNATEAAKRFQKQPSAWLSQRETLEYLAALAKHQNNSCFVQELNKIKQLDAKSAKSRRLVLALVKLMGFVFAKAGTPEHGGGTWMHPKLAVPFARWLNISFSIWCDEQIENISRKGICAAGKTNLLSLLLRDGAAVWELRFKPSYYAALARITGTIYSGHGGGTPALFGQITDRWVYACLLPKDVHIQLKARRGASQKMHQWLTDGGQALLDKQIDLVQSIASTSTDARDFDARMMQLSDKRGQMSFVYPKVM